MGDLKDPPIVRPMDSYPEGVNVEFVEFLEDEKMAQKRNRRPLDVLSSEFTKGGDFSPDLTDRQIKKLIKDEFLSTDGLAFVTFSTTSLRE